MWSVWFLAERQVCLGGNHLRWEAIIEHFQIRPVCFSSGLFHFCAYDEANIQCCNYSPATFHENKQEENAVKLIYTVIFFVCLFVSRGNFVVYLLAAAA